MVRYQSKTFISNKYLAIIYCLPTAYHRITFMNDIKRLKVVFLVEYNKHLALAQTSALFAGFNLIATGLVNCLIVSECSKNAPLRGRKLKNIMGRGHCPSPDPCPIGKGTPLPNPTPSVPAAPRHSGLRRSTCAPHSKILDPLLASSYFPASSSLIH